VTVLHGDQRVRTLRVPSADPRRRRRRDLRGVTDKLDGRPFGPLVRLLHPRALRPPPRVRTGPIDGRLAIHGTDRPDLVGARVSEGCLRATDHNMRWLMRTVPVGTQVTIGR
jgi:lipoprotein-anchoring transpeptidase ErfK/SrfK